ncbi:ACP S-malonyltransferase [Celerinatantimonas yamalensis]|uniref:Malonyl CoA-acyl carrier protein transacylase n=1 Tax=Celerinatantimonas yamalensis TaxID=559956 RepID=A0ABW9G3V6_9GAMM
MSNFAFVFPGQGSQSVGMLSEFAQTNVIVQQTFQQASDALGYNIGYIIEQGPAEKLNDTSVTQPALLACSVALWRVWQDRVDLKPSFLAGHSLGEYSALTCAGVINFADAIRLVELRGQLMQQAVPVGIGAMSAIIGLDNSRIIEVCEQAAQGEIVTAVNFNSPGQVVIAGNRAAVERANILCKEAGAKRALPLPVSVPSHCELMRPAAEKLADKLDSIVFNTPLFKVIHNYNVAISSDAEQIKEALIKQLYSPVRWTETVELMANEGVSSLVECGPGKVLAGLTKRINKQLSAISINDSASLDAAVDLISK